MDIIKRKDAKAAGLVRYFTGVPCPHGHIAERNVKSAGCNECTRLKTRRDYAKNPVAARERQRRWVRNNPERASEVMTKYLSSLDKETRQRRSWKSKNLPMPAYPMPNACECCGKVCTTGRALALDHCHDSDEFRGWLCSACNLAIGKLGDNLEGVMKAVRYLQSRHKTTPSCEGAALLPTQLYAGT